MTRIGLCFNVFMSRKILVKSSSNQRSGPEQRRAHDAGTCSKSVGTCSLGIQHGERTRSYHFITQGEVFLQENATLADISSTGEAALVCLYTCAVGDTLQLCMYTEVAARSSECIATRTRFVQPENLPPTSSAATYHSLRVYQSTLRHSLVRSFRHFGIAENLRPGNKISVI